MDQAYKIRGLADRVALLEGVALQETDPGKAMLNGSGVTITVELPKAVDRGETVAMLVPVTPMSAAMLAAHGLSFKRKPNKLIAEVFRIGTLEGTALRFDRVPDGEYLFALATRNRRLVPTDDAVPTIYRHAGDVTVADGVAELSGFGRTTLAKIAVRGQGLP